MADDTRLKERLRRASDVPAPAPLLEPVTRRARTLRARRGAAAALAVTLIVAALTIPFAGLRHLGEGPLPADTPTGPPAITFKTAHGWHVVMPSGAYPALPGAMATNVAMPPSDGSFGLLTNDQLNTLSADGVVVIASQWLETRNPLPSTGRFRELGLPLRLKDAESVGHGPYEGLERDDITFYYFEGQVRGRALIARVWVGSRHPSPTTLQAAEEELARLVVRPAPAPTAALDQFGIAMTLPAGWTGLLYAGAPSLTASDAAGANLYESSVTRRDLRPGQVAIVLEESNGTADLQGWALAELPITIGNDNRCDGCEVLDGGAPPSPGHALYRRTFNHAGRGFDLYVEFGAEPTQADLDATNAVLATLVLAPLPDAIFTPAPDSPMVGTLQEALGGAPVPVAPSATRLFESFAHATITLPTAWFGEPDPVLDMSQPSSVFAAGTWAFPAGGYCSPLPALQALPDDGALVWVDGYATGYGYPVPDAADFDPWPSTFKVDTGPGTATPCTGGITVHEYRWTMNGKLFRVSVALGPDATSTTTNEMEQAVDSFSTKPGRWG
jgi:hypothetical protein